jgi:hypothetical protein
MEKREAKSMSGLQIDSNNLFPFNELAPQSSPKRCKECRHIEKYQCGGSFFFYCGITKSRRTLNGLKKVLCKTPACGLFEICEDVKK